MWAAGKQFCRTNKEDYVKVLGEGRIILASKKGGLVSLS